ncbi:hypothetical protein BDW69DRAFT_186720 [Aspergillus filifer]
MWRLWNDRPLTKENENNREEKEEDKDTMTVGYMCVPGITAPSRTPTDTIRTSGVYIASYPHLFWLVVPNRDNSVNWFVIIRLDRTHTPADVPRRSGEEVQARLESLGGHTVVAPHRFREFWTITDAVYCVPIHEGMVEVATLGRVTCIGDSAFKMPPYLAQAGNLCMKSAAALANNLRRLNHNHNQFKSAETQIGISEEQVCEALTQTTARYTDRLRQISSVSWNITRIMSLDGWTEWFLYRYIMPPLVGPATYRDMRRLGGRSDAGLYPCPCARKAGG